MRLGVPSFLVTMTIGLHHSTGVPIGTGVMPRATSRSNDALMSAFQWCGTGIGVCRA